MSRPHPTGRRCTVCSNRARAAIDGALARGISLRTVAKRFEVSHWSLHRHRHAHLTPEQIAGILLSRNADDIDLPKLQAFESERLLAEIVAQRERLRHVRDMAVADGVLGLAIAAENSIRAVLELEFKLLGPILAPLFAAASEPDTILRIENVIVRPRQDDRSLDDPPIEHP